MSRENNPNPTVATPPFPTTEPQTGGEATSQQRFGRDRRWERQNPAHRYFIPPAFHDRARAVREALLGLAQRHQTTVDDVARALMRAALDAVQEGEIQLYHRPNPDSRKMTVEVVREGGQPQELPKPQPQPKNPSMNLTYRWGDEVHQAISTLAGDAPQGAVVVLLLEAALRQVQDGNWGLRPRPVSIKQEVVGAIAGKPRAPKGYLRGTA